MHQDGFQLDRTSAPGWFCDVYNIGIIEYLFEKHYNLELNKIKNKEIGIQ